MTVPPISVLLIDDKPRFLERAASFLNQDEHITVVGTAQSGQEGIERAARLRPDAILLDWSMPGESGLELLPILQKASPTSAIIMVTQHEGKAFREAALQARAAAFIPKRMLADALVPSIKRAVPRP